MTQKFINNIWQKDAEDLKRYHREYRAERKIVLKELKIGDQFEKYDGNYGWDHFLVTKINKRTGEITMEYLEGVGM